MNTRALQKVIAGLMMSAACMSTNTVWAEAAFTPPEIQGVEKCLVSMSDEMFPADAVASVLKSHGVDANLTTSVLQDLEVSAALMEERIREIAQQTDPNPMQAPVHGPLLVKIRKKVASEVFNETMQRHGWSDTTTVTAMADEIDGLRSSTVDRCLQAMK